MARIELVRLTKRYPDGFEAVKALDLTIDEGELLVLVGPSGSGKSTVLRMIAGLDDVTEGEVRIDGKAVTNLAPRDRDIAMVFQNYALYPHLTVYENMAFALRLAKRPAAEIDELVLRVAEVLDLVGELQRKPSQLSGGQRQRVAMGRAIVRQPKAFLMDEPLSNLDAKLRVQTRTEVARLQARLGTTTVYVTHDQTEAMTLGDRVAVLDGGQLQQADPPQVLYARPANLFVAGFIGSPAMNFVRARLVDGKLVLPFAVVALDPGVQARLEAAKDAMTGDLIVGIRPEHFARVGERPGTVEFDVDVELVEALGAEQLVHFQVRDAEKDDRLAHGRTANGERAPVGTAATQGARVVARFDALGGSVRPGPTRLAFDPGLVHVFAAGSGEALLSPAAMPEPPLPAGV